MAARRSRLGTAMSCERWTGLFVACCTEMKASAGSRALHSGCLFHVVLASVLSKHSVWILYMCVQGRKERPAGCGALYLDKKRCPYKHSLPALFAHLLSIHKFPPGLNLASQPRSHDEGS